MRVKNHIIALIVITSIASCNTDKRYFNGDIVTQDLPTKMDTLYGEQIELDGLFCGRIIAYDTLLIFKSPKYEDYAMYVFSTNSKIHIASLAPIGDGPNECQSIDYNEQFIIENNEYKLFVILNSYNCRWLNVTASLKQGKTVLEPVLGCPPKLRNDYFFFSLYKNGSFLEQYATKRLNDDGTDYIPPGFKLRNLENETAVKSIKPYKKKIINTYQSGVYLSDQFYFAYTSLKPDYSKLSMGMMYLPQVNIIDLDTWKMTGYRLKMGIDFKMLTKDPAPLKYHYRDGSCDDSYIYLPYTGWKIADRSYIADTHELHVYNWEGAIVKRYFLDHPFFKMAIDPVKGKLYTLNNEEQLFCYCLDL